jgi:hypothetical protein
MACVKCSECGFLTKHEQHSGEYIPVSRQYRETGMEDTRMARANGETLCLMQKADIQAELSTAATRGGKSLDVLSNSRECDGYMPWIPGLTPREHLAMLFEQRLREEIEARRIADESRADERKKGDETRAEGRRRSDRRWSVGQAVVIAVLTIILGILVEPWKERAKQSVQPATPGPSVVNQSNSVTTPPTAPK